MSIRIEKELVRGFVEEARGYIPLIKSAIEMLNSNTNRKSNLEEIHRLIQNIKGASSMIGVTELSDISNYVENTLEDIASEKIEFNSDVLLFLRNATDQINKMLEKLWDGAENLKVNVDDIKDRHRRIYRNQELVDSNYEADKQPESKMFQPNYNSGTLLNIPGQLSDIFNSLSESFSEKKYHEAISLLSGFNHAVQDYKFKATSEITDKIPFLEKCIKYLNIILDDISKADSDYVRKNYISFADEFINLLNQITNNSQTADNCLRKLNVLAESYINNRHALYKEPGEVNKPDDKPAESPEDALPVKSNFSGELMNDFIVEIKNTSNEIIRNLNRSNSVQTVQPLIHKLVGTAGMLSSEYGSDNNKYKYIFRISGFMSRLVDDIVNSDSGITSLGFDFLNDSSSAICRLCDLEDNTYLHGIYLHIEKYYEKISDYHNLSFNLTDAGDIKKPGAGAVDQYYNPTEQIPSELFDIFRIQANEHLEIMQSQIAKYERDFDDLSPLQEVRRGAHTIKGAASMVGLPMVSDIAFCIEESLDRVLEQGIHPKQELTDLLKKSCEILGDLVLQNVPDNVHEEIEELKTKYNEFNSNQAEYDSEYFAETEQYPDYDDEFADKTLKSSGNITKDTYIGFDNDLDDDRNTPAHLSTDIPDELLEVFLVEANEHFNNIGRYLNNISRDHADRETLQEVRRSIHTIKGAAGMVGYDTVSRLAHRMEDLLDNLYEGSMELSDSIIDLLYRTYDLLEELINAKTDNAKMPDTLADIYDKYSSLLGEESPAATKTDQKTNIFGEIDLQSEQLFDELDSYIPPVRDSGLSAGSKKDQTIRKPGEFVRIPIERLDELVNLVSELVVNRSTFEQHFGRFIQELEEMSPSLDRLRKVTANLETEYEVITLGGGKIYAPTEHVQASYDMPFYSSKSYDFDELQFDRYTQFHQHTRELTESASDIRAIGTQMRELTGDFDSYLNRQQRVTSEVQDKLMRLRMVPLSTIITKLHRTARVTASQQNKRVELIIEGEDVELDKTVLEEMADPLLHIVRNSVDHGIELPELRRALNKKQTGTIFIKSYYEGTQVVLEIGDDGAGLVPEVLRNAAVKGGFVSETDSHKLSNEDIYKLIFIPGFSSATQISEISGRGVGMDIVSNTVNKLKGTITVKSIPSKGLTFTIRLPMTLAITKVLLVKANNEILAIPLASVSQIMRLEKGLIENLGDENVIKIDNNLYPIIFMSEALGLKTIGEENIITLPVLIVKIGDKHIALVVEELLESREVVVKTLGSHLKRVHGITGATLMGDGSVVLIINPTDLVMEAPKVEYKVQPRIGRDIRTGILDVLIVDDSLSVRRIMSNLIKSHGWNPIVSKDGVEALELIQRSVKLPDIILLDIEMPRMDGYELTSTLRSQGQYSNIPIIMITSRSGKKHRDKAFELGATDYLVKPYQEKELIELIQRLTGKITGSTLQ